MNEERGGFSPAPLPGTSGGVARLHVRAIADADVATVQAIYAHHVDTGTGSFEETPPDTTEIARRCADVRARGLPFLVATTDDGGVCGFAYAAPFRTRSAYRYTVEDSVYVHPAATGLGVGRALLAELIDRCVALGCRQMIAVIGDSGNQASIALHRSLGFREAGVLRSVGCKFERWLDVVFMQRPL